MRPLPNVCSRVLRAATAAAVAGAALTLAGGVAFASASASHGRDAGVAATPAGDSNAGDIWTETVGQPSGPGHEQDPHLPCADINLWGAHLADPSGTYTIDGWPPSGSQERDYASTWSYDTSTGGTQVISVISYRDLIAAAVANGDRPSAQGYHFKLQLAQDPQKHKTFWIACAAPAAAGAGTTSSGSAAAAVSAAAPAAASGAPALGSGIAAATASGSGGAAGSAAGTTPVRGKASPLAPATALGSAGGVLGITTGTPSTGAAIAAGLALLLIVAGTVAFLASRRVPRMSA